MTSHSNPDKEIKESLAIMGQMLPMMSQDYEPHVRIGAAITFTTEAAKVKNYGLLHPSHHNLPSVMHGQIAAITAILDQLHSHAEQLRHITKEPK